MNFGNISNSLGIIGNLTNNQSLMTLDNKLGLIAETHSQLTGQTNQYGKKNRSVALDIPQLKQAYQRLYPLGVMLQCNYGIYLTDVFKIGGGKIPWFLDSFPLSYLATDAEISLGSLEAESFYAGSHQMNYITQQSNDTMDVTFIETRDMTIAKSYEMCKHLATPKDGSVNEPKKYTFALTAVIFDNKRTLRVAQANFAKRWLVSVKEANFSVSSAGRSEIIKVQITFQKIRPHELFYNQ